MHASHAAVRLRRISVVLSLGAALAVGACGGGGGGGSSFGGSSSSSSSSSSASALTLTIHYKRLDGDYTGWGLHLWNDDAAHPAIATSVATTWTSPHAFDGVTGGWDTAVIPLTDASARLDFIVHKGDAKSPMLDLSVTRATFGSDVWVVQDTGTVYASQADADAAFSRVGHQSDSLDLSAVTVGSTASALPANWNKRGQFMEIFVRSFKDSDGDGKGDIKGLTSKLDYLKSLGVTGLWLMPIYKSQDHDHGYAVADYRAIEPDYGTMADFDDLVTQAHARGIGIGIVLDYVMNHSAAQNPVFLDAVSSTSNAKRDWYLWNATDPGWTGYGGAASWHVSESGYYYGIFADSMPDWNLRNASVVAYHMDNLRFWLNRGVDGFRFDAATSLIENGPTAWYDQPQNQTLLAQARAVIETYANRYMVCEAWDNVSAYAASCGHSFAFGHQGDIKTSATSGALTAGMVGYLTEADRASLPLFMSNHDSGAGARPYSELSGHGEGDYRIAAAIELLASDTPFIYYGEEVGMGNNSDGGDSGVRAPMSWSNTALTAGFTTGTPYRGLAANFTTQNVAAEAGVTGSLQSWYTALLAARASNPVLQSGTLTLLSHAGDGSLIFLRQDSGHTAVVLINLTQASAMLSADTGLASTSFTQLFPAAGGAATSNASGRLSVTVPAQGVVVLSTP
ncbi:alpha-amylase family glycosyl hydrolase [Asticcacaulis solisilvae]|uniref:alpha-amylase family glycosyl hydrolase n=1 Tax=Asticcacaulis solisilvae TaxID=1217274 RepID=UPI003FD8F37C